MTPTPNRPRESRRVSNIPLVSTRAASPARTAVTPELSSRTHEPSGQLATERTVAPFLRWAGGKRWLVPHLKQITADLEFASYHEPFLGSASVFFGLDPQAPAYLSDTNDELVATYLAVRDDPDDIANRLENFENTKETYLELRSSRPSERGERAARFIYLNHTSFNGIYRVNLAGDYNVPYGYRRHLNVPSRETLREVSARLSNAAICTEDFEDALRHVEEGSLVYLDPPYTVAHNNNGFVKYNQRLFSFSDQERLAAACLRIADANAYFILSNAAHQSIHDLFGPIAEETRVSRKSAVGGRASSRGRVDEYVFTNITHEEMS